MFSYDQTGDINKNNPRVFVIDFSSCEMTRLFFACLFFFANFGQLQFSYDGNFCAKVCLLFISELNVSYRVVPITELMAYEFAQAEADFHYLSQSDLSGVLTKSKLSLEQLKDQLRDGHLVLLSDNPSIPILVRDDDGMGMKSWVMNEAAKGRLTPVAQNALLARTRMSGRGAASVSRRLHPPLPMPPYTPEPVVRDVVQPKPLNYEYCLDVACTETSYFEKVRAKLALAKTKAEGELDRWEATPIKHGTRYRVFGHTPEPKRLFTEVASIPMGIWIKPVTMKSRGSNVATEGLIPIRPVVQLGMRLGLPSEGFFYHFHDGKLVQEYRILGEKRHTFYATQTYGQYLNPERGYNVNQSAILVYWKIGNKLVDNQYLVYLDRQITLDELNTLDDEWLGAHGVKLDINALLEALDESPLPRPSISQEEQKPIEIKMHRVSIDPETGERETWRKIAQQYGLAPKALLDLNAHFDTPQKQPNALAVGDELCVDPIAAGATTAPPPKVYGYPPAPPKTYNASINAYYEYNGRTIGDSTLVPLVQRYATPDISIVRVGDVTPYKVFAKSCTQPEGCIDAGQSDEPISNFGPWSLFVAQANANPLGIAIEAAEATQAQMAITASQTAVAGTPSAQTVATSTQLNHIGGTLKDKLIEGYRWQVEGIGALFALQQSLFDDDMQYTQGELRSLGEVQSRIRVHLTEPEVGQHYPVVRAYHADDTRIPVKYVGLDKDQHYSVALDEESGTKIYWTPVDGGDPSWQATPDHDDGFELEDILVTPIHDGDTNATVTTPMPEEQDWRDAILVFPDDSGIAPLYVVYNKPNGDLKYIPAPRGNPPLPAFPDAIKAKKKTSIQGGGKLRERWKDKKGRIYEWDSQHGKIEVYTKNGKHIGEFDHMTGEQTKEADPSRKVDK